jgi:probable addiction module antidote protein
MATSTRRKPKAKTTVFDVAGIARALGDIARAKGMSQVAKEAGLSRESLYRALSEDGNPSFATVLKVARALGVRFHAQPV